MDSALNYKVITGIDVRNHEESSVSILFHANIYSV